MTIRRLLPFTLPGCCRLLLGLLLSAPAAEAAAAPIPVKVVVMTTFEIGKDTGDLPGEFQYWYEREHLTKKFDQPAAYHPYYMNDDGLLVVCTGMGQAKSAASVTMLGLDPRFDLSHAYWLEAGIAGINPAKGSLGSAAWAEWVVDGDLNSEIDAREIPKEWPDGFICSGRINPTDPPRRNEGEVYHLNPKLMEWAYRLTRDVKLADSSKMAGYRAQFHDYPATQRPPFVLKGDNLAADKYWQGQRMTDWAIRWTRLWTGGRGDFATTSCEDSAMMQALTFLAQAKKIDLDRVMVLRTASDICLPPPGMSVADSLRYGQMQAYVAEPECFDAAHRVGSVVVHELIAHWDKYRDQVPEAGGPPIAGEPSAR